ITLQTARQRRDEMRSKVANGINPAIERQQAKVEEKIKLENTFEQVSKDWLKNVSKGLSEHYRIGIEGYFKNHIYQYIGNRPINEITRLELLEVIKIIDQKGYAETARRALNVCGSVWKYAVTMGKTEHNIVADIDKKYALSKTVKQHYPVITEPKELGALLRGIDGYHGSLIVRQALRLAVLVFVRPANIRFAEWREFDFENKVWRIPADKMKMKAPHIVPLCKQALEILEELKPLTGSGKYLFPSPNTTLKPICENTLNQALRRLGYTKEEIVSHSFRGIASTILHENISKHGFHSDVIERQLAHAERNGVKAAYNHAEYLEERTRLMQWWADWLAIIA
ncbi:MAG TPA: tyrosine-type recombinase/integrase, partial [Campylobacterales bacterium]|nr:tyrosine-type recombinase/integrase [Campylobacterales bacterium]